MKKKSIASKARRLRLGIYGGTFDPVHHGHLILARDVLEKLKLDAIIFVPCGQSPLKTRKPLATNARRVAMLRLALKKEPRFWLSRCELDRLAPSYSYDTALEIREAFPRADLFWLIGADQFRDLDKWHRPGDLRKLVKFVLMLRGDEPLKGKLGSVLSLPQPRRIDISATEIRHRVKSRQPIDHLVPTPIAAYIKRHGLYLS
jgi:nicotinate-nucleotide adenylyltransferase